ncbi:hypothetical protein [Mycetocola saprophilus]|uniref:hypothetical protein n=1 Tax=Mycetocola saprophilus TaxID=76636 RepID=UPI0004BEA449|nr:hypothetical protein [Mycetocola saprophilus]
MTEKIDHKRHALAMLAVQDGVRGPEITGDTLILAAAAEAQVHATLYLAEQQAAAVEQARIANIISLLLANRAPSNAVVEEWTRDIEKGLGL